MFANIDLVTSPFCIAYVAHVALSISRLFRLEIND